MLQPIRNKHRKNSPLWRVVGNLNAAASLVDISCHQIQANTVLGAHNVVFTFRLAAESLAENMRLHRILHPAAPVGHLDQQLLVSVRNAEFHRRGDRALVERAEVIREKGTNRSQFFRGQVDKYTWRDIGSSYLMADLQAAYLWAQLEAADRINLQRLSLWQTYYDALEPLAKAGRIALPTIPADCVHNAHMFYIKLRDNDDRSELIAWLKEAEIMAVFHYIPLHSSPAGEAFGTFAGEDRYTTKESERLLRLPLFYNLAPVNQRTVINTLLSYFG